MSYPKQNICVSKTDAVIADLATNKKRFPYFQPPVNGKKIALRKAVTIAAMPGCRNTRVRTNHNNNGRMNTVGPGIGKELITC